MVTQLMMINYWYDLLMASKKIHLLLMTNVILIPFSVSNGVSADSFISHVSISSSKSIISQQGNFTSQSINDFWKLDWEQTFGEFDDGAYSVITTGDGGYLITGDTWSYGASAGDIFLLKIDSSAV